MVSKVAISISSTAAVIVAVWLCVRLATQPRVTPSVKEHFALSQDAQPTLVQVSQLPSLEGYASLKPVVAADASGNVVVVSYGAVNDPPGIDILKWQSGDRGHSWQSPQNLTNSAKTGVVNFDPWMESDGDRSYYVVYAQKGLGNPIVLRSRDTAKSWSDAREIPWKHCDRPVLGISPNGKTLVVAAAMSGKSASYPTEPLDANDPNLQEKLRAAFINYAGVFVSRDQGDTWSKWTSPFGERHAIPFAVVIDDENRVAASWIVEGDGSQSVVSITNDDGKTWTNTTLVESLQPDRSHHFNGERFPVVALDGAQGLHVAFVNIGARALLVRSSNDWKSWTKEFTLSDDAIDEVRMAAIDACGARVHVTWMERTGTVWHAFYRGSSDSGKTWSPALCLSQEIGLSDSTVANGFEIYGDDDQSSVREDGRGRVHAVWSFRGGRVAHAVIDWLPSK